MLFRSQCCHPVPGDPIIAYASPGKGLVIHHELCSNLKNRKDDPKHYMSVDWEKSDTQIEFETELRIEMINQQGTLPHLMSTISSMDSNIQSILDGRTGRSFISNYRVINGKRY